MNKSLSKFIIWVPLFFCLAFYFWWLHRAYEDVAYMDQVNVIAGNLKHLYNGDASIQDFYYRSPFLLFFSTIIVFINCKLFGYNTYFETITSGLVLFFIAWYFIKTMVGNFAGRERLYFAAIASVIVLCLTKWEMSLWGGGFSHYMVVAAGFICVKRGHEYYMTSESKARFIPLYILLSVMATLETTSYFLPFQLSLLIIMGINYRLFRDKISLRKWRVLFAITVALVIFSIGINYMAEWYAKHHYFEGYGKVNLAHSLGQSLEKVIKEPMFVVKFFFISMAGNLVDKDFYSAGSIAKPIMPFIGAIMLFYFAAAIFLFIKRRPANGIFPITLVLASLIFLGTVLMGRMSFNDVYYGASSRYAAETFAGLLGLSTLMLLFMKDRKLLFLQKIFYIFPIALIVLCCANTNLNQFLIGPYQRENFLKMKENLKANKNLESLFAYSPEIASHARDVMIQNKLNVFKPQKTLKVYTLYSNFEDASSIGFYNEEIDEHATYRWTDGHAMIFLPNLYSTGDSVKLKINCYNPQNDTPKVILNDRFEPYKATQVDGGYEYYFAFDEQKVFFRIQIDSKSVIPAEADKNSKDTRKLGLIFQSLTLSN